MLIFLSRLLSGANLYILIAVISFSGGLYAMHTINTASHAKELEQAVNRAIEQSEQLRELDNQILSDAIETVEKIQEKRIYINREITKYVKDDSNCNLTAGALRLLNNSREGLPETTATLTGKEQAITDFTQLNEIESHIDCAIRYQKLATKHDALIDWINKQ